MAVFEGNWHFTADLNQLLTHIHSYSKRIEVYESLLAMGAGQYEEKFKDEILTLKMLEHVKTNWPAPPKKDKPVAKKLPKALKVEKCCDDCEPGEDCGGHAEIATPKKVAAKKSKKVVEL